MYHCSEGILVSPDLVRARRVYIVFLLILVTFVLAIHFW
jgi:hypothetical protein